MRKGIFFFSGLALFSSAPSFAVISLPSGWYLDANAGWSEISTKGSDDNQTGPGGNINFGYKLMPFFAAEIGLTKHASSYIRGPNNKKAATETHMVYDVAGKGIVPIGVEGFELFAKLGYQKTDTEVDIDNPALAASMGITDSSESSCGLYLGVGAQYNWSPSIGLAVQWQRAVADNGDTQLDLLSGGIIYIW